MEVGFDGEKVILYEDNMVFTYLSVEEAEKTAEELACIARNAKKAKKIVGKDD